MSERQQPFIGGGQYLFSRKRIDNTFEPLRDLGTLSSPPAINFASEEAILRDSRSGTNVDVASRTTSASITYTLQLANFSPDNLAIAFGSDKVETFSQSAATIAATLDDDISGGAPIEADSIVLLYNTSGARVYDIASITSVTTGAGPTVLVQGTDWEVDAGLLKLGAIRLLPGANITSNTIVVTYVTKAISGLRALSPLKEIRVEGRGILLLSGEDYAKNVLHDVHDVVLSTSAIALNSSDFSSLTINARVLNDTGKVDPAGRMLILGQLPRRTF